MAKEHYNAQLQYKMVGNHEGVISADIDWNERNVGTVDGSVELKMLKHLNYKIANGSTAEKLEDGTVHVNAKLENSTGAERNCALDISPDGTVLGTLEMPDGKTVDFHGIRT